MKIEKFIDELQKAAKEAPGARVLIDVHELDYFLPLLGIGIGEDKDDGEKVCTFFTGIDVQKAKQYLYLSKLHESDE